MFVLHYMSQKTREPPTGGCTNNLCEVSVQSSTIIISIVVSVVQLMRIVCMQQAKPV